MILNSDATLRFGDLDLIGSVGSDWVIAALAEGATLGNPVPVNETIQTLLADGSQVATRSHDNRQASFQVQISASDAAALADAEAALFAECSKVNTLSWTPPDGYGATTVFEVQTSSLEFAFDDLNELRILRAYTLTLICEPFGRSAVEVIDPALTVGVTPTSVTLADGSSAAGWTSPDGAVTSSGTYLLVPSGDPVLTRVVGGQTKRDYYPDATLTMTATDFSATPYITLEVTADNSWETIFAPSAFVDGVQLQRVATVRIDGGVRATFLSVDASATTLRVYTLVRTTSASSTAPDASLRLSNVTASNQPPNASTTGRESLRTVTVAGSARTQGSLSISHDTDGLGDVLAYTSPALSTGYTPDLRRWRKTNSNNPTTDDTSLVSGTWNPLVTADTFALPATSLVPGGYVMLARMASGDSGGANVTVKPSWTAATVIGTTSFGEQSGEAASTTLTTAYQWVVVGGMTLPPTDIAEASVATVQVTLDVAGVAVKLDEVCLFYQGDDSALTWVPCGAGVPSAGTVHNRLWIDTASEDRITPAVWLGTVDDRSDAFHAGDNLPAWGTHLFPPGDVGVFVVTTGAANPDVALRHFPRWFTHAAA